MDYDVSQQVIEIEQLHLIVKNLAGNPGLADGILTSLNDMDGRLDEINTILGQDELADIFSSIYNALETEVSVPLIGSYKVSDALAFGEKASGLLAPIYLLADKLTDPLFEQLSNALPDIEVPVPDYLKAQRSVYIGEENKLPTVNWRLPNIEGLDVNWYNPNNGFPPMH